MKNRVLVFIAAAILAVSVLSAGMLDIADIERAADTRVQLMNNRMVNAGVFDCVRDVAGIQPVFGFAGELLAYVFELEPEGFVVMATDDDVSPVIAYSEHGRFSFSEEDVLHHMIREDLTRRMACLDMMPVEVLNDHRQYWQGLIEGDPEYTDPGDSWPLAGQTWTGGWIETVWTQSAPYNDYCPIDPVTEVRCYAGCPATAMAQIINFWQYPDSVIFDESDSYVSDYAGRIIPIDAPAASIPEIEYEDGQPSTDMAARLTYAAGVAIESVYSSQGSGVFTNSVCADGFVDDFEYDSAVFRDGDGGDFYEVMEQNMKDSMPAIIVIIWSFKPGGHTLPCDGFREGPPGGDDEWHLNFGYGGSTPDPIASAWYVIPDGLPYEFDIVHEGIMDIKAPRRPEPVAVEEVESLEYLRMECTWLSSDPVQVEFTLTKTCNVSLTVWDVTGREVEIIQNGLMTAGSHQLKWDGTDSEGNELVSGIYFLRLDAGEKSVTRKLILAR